MKMRKGKIDLHTSDRRLSVRGVAACPNTSAKDRSPQGEDLKGLHSREPVPKDAPLYSSHPYLIFPFGLVGRERGSSLSAKTVSASARGSLWPSAISLIACMAPAARRTLRSFSAATLFFSSHSARHFASRFALLLATLIGSCVAQYSIISDAPLFNITNRLTFALRLH